MAAITIEDIAAAYNIAKEVYAENLKHSDGVNTLAINQGMNRNSASDYINNLGLMLDGLVYKRTNSAIATEYYLKKIAQDYSVAQFENALKSVALHISYYEDLRQVNLISLRRVLVKHADSSSLEPSVYDEERATQKNLSSDGALSESIQQMIRNARIADGLSGTKRVSTSKIKKVKFGNDEAFSDFIKEKIIQQDGKCALSGIELQYRGLHSNNHFLCSLDRIDSSGDYEPSNLQVVCQFINRWKSDSNNDEFLILLNHLKSQ